MSTDSYSRRAEVAERKPICGDFETCRFDLGHGGLHSFAAATPSPDARAIVETTLGFDPTNHHNAAKCPYCTPSPDAGIDVERLRDAAIGLLIAVDNASFEALADAEDGSEEPDWQTRLWDAADAARAVLPVVFGPVACAICGLAVVWNGVEWRGPRNTRRHVCGEIVRQSRGARRIAARRLYMAVQGETLP